MAAWLDLVHKTRTLGKEAPKTDIVSGSDTPRIYEQPDIMHTHTCQHTCAWESYTVEVGTYIPATPAILKWEWIWVRLNSCWSTEWGHGRGHLLCRDLR